MTIDEVIVSLRKSASKSLDYEWQREQYQLAEWLEELKVLRLQNHLGRDESLIAGRKEGYNKAIDDFVKEICKMIAQSEKNGNYRFYAVEIKQAIADIAEQLKAGAEE